MKSRTKRNVEIFVRFSFHSSERTEKWVKSCICVLYAYPEHIELRIIRKTIRSASFHIAKLGERKEGWERATRPCHSNTVNMLYSFLAVLLYCADWKLLISILKYIIVLTFLFCSLLPFLFSVRLLAAMLIPLPKEKKTREEKRERRNMTHCISLLCCFYSLGIVHY